MRQHPDHTSPVVSEAFFSEEVTPLAEEGEWLQILTQIDNYQGWVPVSSVHKRTSPFGKNYCVQIKRCAAHLYHVPDTIYGPVLTLPFESILELSSETPDTVGRWLSVIDPQGQKLYIQSGDVSTKRILINFSQLGTFSSQFLGIPYTWGGRCSFGYDCSGFIQMLYRQTGVFLPRDAREQILSPLLVPSSEPRRLGDLLFFGITERQIQHVGMCLGSETFIHATVAENQPYIRISSIACPEWSGKGKYPYYTARRLLNGVD